jgi:hypothetical protein
VLLTHVDPDHAAGAEAVAERAGVPVVVGPGGGAPLPYEVTELAHGQPVRAGDLGLRAIATPGLRPDHLAFIPDDGGFALAGDLDGIRGRRSIFAERTAARLPPRGNGSVASSRRPVAGRPPGSARGRCGMTTRRRRALAARRAAMAEPPPAPAPVGRRWPALVFVVLALLDLAWYVYSAGVFVDPNAATCSSTCCA